ncbi:hypothetical protein SK128_027267 [Halocaridina rubra]|uniref:Ion transport domain-containing protein n=1 Tax=Halocaridina rubra TaxID=373956 RepID=A0AAN9A8Q9_HALRR
MNGSGGNAPGGDGEDYYTQQMLTAVKEGDKAKLQEALKHLPAKFVNYIYPHPVSATALHIACQKNYVELVAILLEASADPNAKDLKGKKYCPIHHAAQKGNAEILKALLKAGADPNAKEGEFGRTPLHILANSWKETNEDAFKGALEVLLKCKKISVDTVDNNSASQLFMAATKGWKHMVEKLIYKGAKIDSTVGNTTAADIIRQRLPGVLESINFNKVEKPQRYFGDELNSALMNHDFEQFTKLLTEIDISQKQNKQSILDENHGDHTLLTYACDNGLFDFVAQLLKHEANPIHIDETAKTSPMLYAARNGYHNIIELLISSMKDSRNLEKALKQTDLRCETPLHKVVKKEYPMKKEGVDYYRCLQLLLDKKQYLDIDAVDEFDNTPLHYAVLCDDQSFVRMLLLNGAHLGIRNKFGTLAITRIQVSVLEEVLNECIKHKNKVTDSDFEIILHYSLLAPAEASQQPETECLRFLSESQKHKRLLRHPIIDTFLFLKWQKIKKYYFFNIIAYTVFLILLTAYILIYHGTVSSRAADENGNETGILTPNLTNDSQPANDTGEVPDNLTNNFLLKCVLQIIIALLAFYIAIREGVQFFVSWKLYIIRLENWLEISIIVLTAILLFIPLDDGPQKSLSAWLVLFSWTEFILLLGRLPYFAVYITMFTKVTFNFLKLILMFSFLIFAFSISFYLVFQINEHFNLYHLALLKTIAMTTGELEYTELPLSTFSGSSHLLFVLFVFLIVLVLMNLLNGLAVSDIHKIEQDAEIVSYISRVELISYIESVFLGSPFKRFLPGPITCCENDAEDCYLVTCGQSHNPARKLLHWMGKRTLMFHSCLRDHRITMYPNRCTHRWHVCDCHSFCIEEKQIEAAKDVVLEKENSAANRHLSGLENRLEEVVSAIALLTEKVNQHVLCPSPQ